MLFTPPYADIYIYISVHELQKLLFKDEMDIILSIYAITDPDTVSIFYGHGKTQTIKVMRQHAKEHWHCLAFLVI